MLTLQSTKAFTLQIGIITSVEATAEAIESEAIAEATETEVLALVPTRNQEVNTLYIKLKDAAPRTIPLKSSKSLETSL